MSESEREPTCSPSLSLSERFPIRHLPEGYSIQPGVYCPPNAFYCEVPLEEGEETLMGGVIGRQGFYFKAITSATRVYYIWYAENRKVIEIWGPERRLPLAVERIRQRIQRVKEQRQHQLKEETTKDTELEQ